MGKSWQRITTGLPRGVYVHVIKEDPKHKGLLVAGTERGAFISLDDGDAWQPLQLNLPVTSVRDFQIHDNDLIVGTHGRGIWVIEDLSPLRQLDTRVLAADVHLFKPASITSSVPGDENGTPLPKDEPHADNPVEGVVIYYYLKSAVTGPITLEILDAKGARAATIPPTLTAADSAAARTDGIPRITVHWVTPPDAPLSTAPGLHRVIWPTIIPPSEDPAAPIDEQRARIRSGTFTARLTVGGKSYVQSFEVTAAVASE
jgi:hypothetical protein